LVLPTKRLPEDRALLAIGADTLQMLSRPLTVSKLWEEMKRKRTSRNTSLPFDWFVLGLSFLFAIGVIDLRDGRLFRVGK
jgi:hypothetical protein